LSAAQIASSHGDAVERRRFRHFLSVNELNEAELLFLNKLWKKNRAEDESICRFMERQGWLMKINEFAITPCVEEFGFEADEFPRSSIQLTGIGVQALRNGMQSNVLFEAIFSLFTLFGRQASLASPKVPLPSCKSASLPLGLLFAFGTFQAALIA